jgi:hypothetical protein
VPAFLSSGFRPFFLAAGLWAVMALLLWIGVFVTGATLPSRFDPLAWHIHDAGVSRKGDSLPFTSIIGVHQPQPLFIDGNVPPRLPEPAGYRRG